MASEQINNEATDTLSSKETKLSEEVAAKVLRQVEFYFSDSNLPRDKFLLEKVNEGNGLVPLDLICSFSRMKSHLGISNEEKEIPEDVVKAVAAVLKSSSTLKFSEDGKQIGRSTALMSLKDLKLVQDSRTIYASPFPWKSRIEEIEAVFSKFGTVRCVRLRRHPETSLFAGGAFVELESEEEAKNVREKFEKEKIEANGVPLIITSKKEFLDKWHKEHPNKTEDDVYGKDEKEPKKENKRKSPEQLGFQKGLILGFSIETKEEKVTNGTLNEEVPEASKLMEEAENLKEEVNGEAEAKEDEKEETKVEENESEGPRKKPRTEAGEINEIRWELVKEVLSKFGHISYVDFRSGQTSGFVRFSTASSVSQACEGEGTFSLSETNMMKVHPVSGEEEEKYWTTVRSSQARKKADNKPWRGRGGSSRGSRGRFGGRGRGGDRGGRGQHKKFD